MAAISMKELLEAGVHFGHQTRRWNPKMAQYIFTERNGIYILDLQKTVRKIDEAYAFVRDIAMEGKTILFVGTKKQAQEPIESEAKRCNMFYINNRWLGGMLTNFKTIRIRIERLNQIDDMEKNGLLDSLPKTESFRLINERKKLETDLGGIREMKKLPGALFIVDPRKEHIAVTEARILGIPIVGIVDTNCDPDEIDYVIPGNDDAIRAVKLITSKIADAVLEGQHVKEQDEGFDDIFKGSKSQHLPPNMSKDVILYGSRIIQNNIHRLSSVNQSIRDDEIETTNPPKDEPNLNISIDSNDTKIEIEKPALDSDLANVDLISEKVNTDCDITLEALQNELSGTVATYFAKKLSYEIKSTKKSTDTRVSIKTDTKKTKP